MNSKFKTGYITEVLLFAQECGGCRAIVVASVLCLLSCLRHSTVVIWSGLIWPKLKPKTDCQDQDTLEITLAWGVSAARMCAKATSLTSM